MVRSHRLVWVWVAIGVFSVPAFGSDPQPKTWQNAKDHMEFVWIPAGSVPLKMPGEKDATGKEAEKQVQIDSGFWMGKTEVTVEQYRRFVHETGYRTEAEQAGNRFTWKAPGFKQGDHHPVVYLSYLDALQYCDWAKTDLPSDAEWYYAARAGTNTRFYWGDQLDDRYVWHRSNTEAGTQPVAKKIPNAWGLYDMVGNAWEYCRTCGPYFVAVGGSWTRCPEYKIRQGSVYYPFQEILVFQITNNKIPRDYPWLWDDDRGFRCVQRNNQPVNLIDFNVQEK